MTIPFPDEELAAIRDRANRCLEGPWIHRGDGFIETVDHRVIGVTCAGGGDCGGDRKLPRAAHASFLAAAREDVPRLLEEIARLRTEVDRLQGTSGNSPLHHEAVPLPKLPFRTAVL